MYSRSPVLARNVFEAFVWIALASGAVVLSSGFAPSLSDKIFSSATWPRIIAAGLVLATIGQLIIGDPVASDSNTPEADHPPFRRVLTAVLVSALYIQCITWGGFYLVTPFFVCGYLVVFGEKRLSRLVPFAIVVSGVFYLAFTTFLFISLPTGSFDALHAVNIAIQEAFIIEGSK
ncbi:tripartite tricarboxylate transporter TctB family protein [Roseovarius aestuarii]|nr:tripartite tricarboxylate transporter TctB family protein [Roseovarius aestuarii]